MPRIQDARRSTNSKLCEIVDLCTLLTTLTGGDILLSFLWTPHPLLRSLMRTLQNASITGKFFTKVFHLWTILVAEDRPECLLLVASA